MNNFKSRLEKLERRIILSQKAEINDKDFQKLLHVISDNDLSLLCNSSGETLVRNTKEFILKYKTEIDSYELNKFEKLEATFFRDEIDKLSFSKKDEISRKTELGHKIISEILNHWEERLKVLTL